MLHAPQFDFALKHDGMRRQYGANPTGVTSTLERRLEVLELARKHNFLILEGSHVRSLSAVPLLISRMNKL